MPLYRHGLLTGGHGIELLVLPVSGREVQHRGQELLVCSGRRVRHRVSLVSVRSTDVLIVRAALDQHRRYPESDRQRHKRASTTVLSVNNTVNPHNAREYPPDLAARI